MSVLRGRCKLLFEAITCLGWGIRLWETQWFLSLHLRFGLGSL